MNILLIGNSFSVDATRYLHQIAKSTGEKIDVATLYIGGCPLSTHYKNMLSCKEHYELFYNGNATNFFVNINDALLNRAWDVVTVQQVSSKSVDYKTYQPYLNKLVKRIRSICPSAKIIVHQTWSYEEGSERLTKELGYSSMSQMTDDIVKANLLAKEEINAYGIIPSGQLINALASAKIGKLHRDTYHLSLGLGRYAVALLWFRLLTGNSVKGVKFCDLDEKITKKQMKKVKKMVDCFSPIFSKK